MKSTGKTPTLDPREQALKDALLRLADPAGMRRVEEIRRLKAMLPAIEKPKMIGREIVTRADHKHFTLAVSVSHRTTDHAQNKAFGEAIAEAVRVSDARFFEVVAAGMRYADRQRADGFNRASAHAFLALVAKLELEDRTGRLPDTLAVSKRAAEIGRTWFKGMPVTIAGPRDKATWSKARNAAGIRYLEAPKRGKGVRVARSA